MGSRPHRKTSDTSTNNESETLESVNSFLEECLERIVQNNSFATNQINNQSQNYPEEENASENQNFQIKSNKNLPKSSKEISSVRKKEQLNSDDTKKKDQDFEQDSEIGAQFQEASSSAFAGAIPESSAMNNEINASESCNSLTEIMKKISSLVLFKKSNQSKAKETNRNDANETNDSSRESSRRSSRKLTRRPVIISYPESQKPRQPFMNQPASNRLPNPPPYYSSAVIRNQPRSGNFNSRDPRGGYPPRYYESQNQPREEIVLRPNYQPGQIMMMPNTLMNISYWAPYPDNIPSNIPPCLAHLVAADSLFVIQQMDVIELFLDITEPNYYLIQNTSGQCLYYAYETTDICLSGLCKFSRGFQLHIMDMYHNEIIYINKPCGCNNCCCCYPVLEVYSPPLVPVGAITQKFSISRTEFAILDADENKTFSIYGPCCCVTSCRCGEADFTIHALDWAETEVGVIRRQIGGFITAYYTNTDYYGITFPVDLDVRIKAVFLGALFLIEYSYYDDGNSNFW